MSLNTAVSPAPDFRALFESAPGLYLVLTPDLKIVAVSEAYLKATMTKREAILGRGLFEVFPDNPDDPSANGVGNLNTSLQKVIKNRTPDTMAVQKYDIRRPDTEGGGFEERYWSPMNSPVFGKDGELVYVIHRVEDVTEFIHLKQLKNEQNKLAEELLTRTQQMEAEIFLRAQEIQKANQQLETVNKELESFSYSVAHDLRAPLRAIDGFSRMLIEDYSDQLPQDAQSLINRVSAAAQRMAQLVDNLLNLSRVTRMPLGHNLVDLSALAERVLTKLQSEQPERQVTVTIASGLTAYGDRHLLQIALENLLHNAWKFTSKKDTAHIEFGIQSTSEKKVYFIRDDGAGFDMAYKDKLFGAFQRLHTADEYPGIGMGLAMVQRIIQRHGGRIWMESFINDGATFYFTLHHID